MKLRNDYSYLFSGLNQNNSSYSVSGMTSLLTDYSAIKSGSYGKLLKTYYADEAKKTGSTDKAEQAEDVKKSNALVTDTRKQRESTFNQIKADANALQSSVEELGKVSGEDADASYKAAQKYVKSYNSLLKSAKQVDQTSIAGRLNTILNQTTASSKELAKLGMTVNSDGTLSLDEETYRAADDQTRKNLFSGKGNYGYAQTVSAAMIQSTAGYEASVGSLYSENGSYQASVGSLYSGLI